MKTSIKYGLVLVVGLLVGWVYANFSFDDERYRLLGCLQKIDKIKITSKNLNDATEKSTNSLDKKIKQQKKLLSLRG